MPDYYVGLMSGTSCDGLDAVLVDFSAARVNLLATYLLGYDADLRQRLFAAAAGRSDNLDEIARLDAELGALSAQAVGALLRDAGIGARAVRAIGSHGHTLRHRPQASPPFTAQIGDPQRLAKLTGITTVADFRRADIAVGGQGAPLAPGFHAAYLRDANEVRGVLNLGGIANLTVLPPPPGEVIGFDTGPGNALMDDWARAQHGQDYDAAGAWAAGGAVDEALLSRLLDDAYFARPPPKSSGREHFNLAWLSAAQGDVARAPRDVQATLCELTACSVAAGVRQHAAGAARLLVCGGGIHNTHLLARLRQHVDCLVESTATLGVPPDWLEAAAFAWLAKCALEGTPGNLPTVTGAARAVVLGAIHPP